VFPKILNPTPSVNLQTHPLPVAPVQRKEFALVFHVMSLIFHAFFVSLPTRLSPSECLLNVRIGYGMGRPHISRPGFPFPRNSGWKAGTFHSLQLVLCSYANRQFCIYLSINQSKEPGAPAASAHSRGRFSRFSWFCEQKLNRTLLSPTRSHSIFDDKPTKTMETYFGDLLTAGILSSTTSHIPHRRPEA